MKEINIAGRRIEVQQCTKGQLKGLTIGDSLIFSFYVGIYGGIELLFVEPKHENPSPRNCAITARNLSSKFQKPVVFILSACPSYERQRLMDKDVYFVIGDNFANLPMLVANERLRKSALAKRLTPVAQYILLYHLQIESLEGMTARTMTDKIPYSYESITLGLTCLTDLKICEKIPDGMKSKSIHFQYSGKELWLFAQSYLQNPVEQKIYCDEMKDEATYPICGINALSHYSRLNPDSEREIMMDIKRLRNKKKDGSIINANVFDGNIIIEGWKYPPVHAIGDTQGYVDKLSLVLSLKDDPDVRVEGELERIIKEFKWLD